MTEDDLRNQIKMLKEQLSGSMFQDMPVRDKIHNLEMQLKGIRPMDSKVECIGCGA